MSVGLSDEELDDRVRAPKRVSGDEGTVEERDADQTIQLDVYSKSASKPPYGMRLARVAPRGTVG
jgi:hypothetical protein